MSTDDLCKAQKRTATPDSPPTSPSSVIPAHSSTSTGGCQCNAALCVAGREYDVYNVGLPTPVSRLAIPLPASAVERPASFECMSRRTPSDLLSSGASFATLSVLDAVVKAVEEASGRPELTPDGTSGVYLIRSCRPSNEEIGPPEKVDGRPPESAPVAVFKPTDEEAGSFNNPRGLRGAEHVMREGFRLGDGAVREMVAYRLDHRGLAGVPKTTVDRLMLRTRTGTRLQEQTGSIQEFVPSQGDVGEYRFDGSEFCERASQRLALLDLRLFNCDRHEGNILVRPQAPPLPSLYPPASADQQAAALPEHEHLDDKLGLVPIDHAFVLPRFGYFREAEFAWRYWLAASVPFGSEAVEYVASIDVAADVEVARRAGLDEASCATLRTCTMLLQAALLGGGRPKREVEAEGGSDDGGTIAGGRDDAGAACSEREGRAKAVGGVTPKELASVLMREHIDEPSPFERLCAQALGIADAGTDTALIDHVRQSAANFGGAASFVPPDNFGGAASFVPPDEFYVRFAALLENEYGPPRQSSGARSEACCWPRRSSEGDALAHTELPMRRVRSCVTVPAALPTAPTPAGLPAAPPAALPALPTLACGDTGAALHACPLLMSAPLVAWPAAESTVGKEAQDCVVRAHTDRPEVGMHTDWPAPVIEREVGREAESGAQRALSARPRDCEMDARPSTWPHDCEVGVHTDQGGVPFMEDAHCVHHLSHGGHQTGMEGHTMSWTAIEGHGGRPAAAAVFAVYDGHGGDHAAHYCRDHLHRSISDALEAGHTPTDALLAGFARTEAGLLGGQRQQRLGGAMCGATATVALLREDSVHLAWLGDCRGVLCRGGEAIELTRDHTLSGGADDCGERARVLREGGQIEADRLWGFLEVARAFGDLEASTGCKPPGLSATPELRSQRLHPEDEFVLLASDGLWRVLDSQAAVRLARADLRAHANATMAAERLVEGALHTRRVEDNITVVVVLLRPVEPNASTRQRPRLQLMKRGTCASASMVGTAPAGGPSATHTVCIGPR